MITIPAIPDELGVGGAYLARDGAAGSPDLPTLLQAMKDAIEEMQGRSAGAAGPALTDANQTLLIDDGAWRTQPAGSLTANRVKTLSPTGATGGDQFTITRLDAGAFTLTIANGGPGGGNVAVLPVSKTGTVIAQFDGTNWVVRSVSVGS